MTEWKAIEKFIRLLVRFLSEKGLRDRFIHICLKDCPQSVKNKFSSWSGKKFDWRWEPRVELVHVHSG
jgi:hypothetical protein